MITGIRFMMMDAVRCFLGCPSNLEVIDWKRNTGPVIVELPRAPYRAVGTDLAALEDALAHRRNVPAAR
jgi:hypothetical protein